MKTPVFVKIVDATLNFLFEIKPSITRFIIFLSLFVYIGIGDAHGHTEIKKKDKSGNK